MKFKVDNGPHIKSDDNTSLIMIKVIIALIPIICFSIYKNSFWVYFNGRATLIESLHPIFMIVIAVLTSVASEIAFIRFILKKKDADFYKVISNSYAVLPGLFLALVLPINTPLIMVVIGAIFASIVGKMLFGGFGHNIFNPALVGVLFVIASYGSVIASNGGYLNALELDAVGGATPLTNLSNFNYVAPYYDVITKYGDFSNFFFGTIPGALGETSKFLILLALIYLTFSKVLKWRIPIVYITTVFIMTFIIGITNNMGLWYPLFHILSGSLLFGAVFMATDPVTSPITKSGQILFGIGLGILTVIFRFLTPYPEGVLTAILTMNMLVIPIDKIGVKINFELKKMIIPLSILIVLLLGISFYISYDIKNPDKSTANNNVQIIDVKKSNKVTTYTLTSKGWNIIKAEVEVKNNRITKISIIDSSGETMWSEIEKNDYLNKLIREQNNIQNIDTISGATKTSNGLKNIIIKVIEKNIR